MPKQKTKKIVKKKTKNNIPNLIGISELRDKFMNDYPSGYRESMSFGSYINEYWR